MESDVLSPGEQLTTIKTDYGKMGIGICYDLRFPEMAMIASRQDCAVMVYPGYANLLNHLKNDQK